MTDFSFDELLALLEEDRPLLEMLRDEGLIAAPLERAYGAAEAEAIRIARVLVRELDVNLPGVEIILHMRAQIVALRRQIGDAPGQEEREP